MQVIFFSTDIFHRAGLDEMQAQSATLGMGAMNVLMTIISVILVEKAGRKTLQLFGLSGMFVTTVLLTLCLALKVRKQDAGVDCPRLCEAVERLSVHTYLRCYGIGTNFWKALGSFE